MNDEELLLNFANNPSDELARTCMRDLRNHYTTIMFHKSSVSFVSLLIIFNKVRIFQEYISQFDKDNYKDEFGELLCGHVTTSIVCRL